MTILHIAAARCFTDIVEIILAVPGFPFMQHNAFGRDAYSLS